MPYMQHLTGMNVIVFSMVFSITKTFIYFLSKKGPKLLLLLYLNVPCCTAVHDTVDSLSDGENRRLVKMYFCH